MSWSRSGKHRVNLNYVSLTPQAIVAAGIAVGVKKDLGGLDV